MHSCWKGIGGHVNSAGSILRFAARLYGEQPPRLARAGVSSGEGRWGCQIVDASMQCAPAITPLTSVWRASFKVARGPNITLAALGTSFPGPSAHWQDLVLEFFTHVRVHQPSCQVALVPPVYATKRHPRLAGRATKHGLVHGFPHRWECPACRAVLAIHLYVYVVCVMCMRVCMCTLCACAAGTSSSVHASVHVHLLKHVFCNKWMTVHRGDCGCLP